MLDVARQLINGITSAANGVELPTRIITILGILSTALGYGIGRHRALVERPTGGTNDALLAEMRQGFAAVSAALGALSAGPPATNRSDAATTASAPNAPLAPLVQPPPPVAPPLVSVATPAQSAFVPRAARAWAGRPALAVCSAVALALTLAGMIGALIVRGDSAVFAAFSLLALLGLALAGVTFVWASAATLRLRRWGWATAIFFGTLAVSFITAFTLPTLLTLIFAVWGPPAPSRSRTAWARRAAVSPAFVPLAASPLPPSAATSATSRFDLSCSPAASPDVMPGGAIPLRPAPPSGRLMPPTFPGPARMLAPVPAPPPGEETYGG